MSLPITFDSTFRYPNTRVAYDFSFSANSVTVTSAGGSAYRFSLSGTINAVGDTVTLETFQNGASIGTQTLTASNLDNSNSIVFNIVGARYYFANTPYSEGQTITYSETNLGDYTAPTCFLSGTLIRTAAGDRAIETLQPGDVAVTAAGEQRVIRWVGHSALASRRGESGVALVRIAAGALGVGRPARDLVVTPAHAIALDMLGEVLVPAASLVNGATIRRETVPSATVWHVELDSHDLLLAEGQAAESFLDMGNRRAFVDGAVVALDADPDGDPALRTHADFCRPYHAEGPVIEVARAQLRRRAAALGWSLSDPAASDPWQGVHLEVDGRVVRPVTRGLSARFAVPAGAVEAWLVSPASAPHDVGDSPDGRSLGLFVQGLSVDDGWTGSLAIPLDDPALDAGFYGVEGAAEAPARWTAGRARLPGALWAGMEGAVTLRVDLVAPGLARWVAPQVEAEALAA